MPEGHTVHRLARDLRDTLGSAPVTATSPQGRFEAGARLLDGETIARSEAWGKYLFVSFGGPVLHVHLGLIGKFRDRGRAAAHADRHRPIAAGQRRRHLGPDRARARAR